MFVILFIISYLLGVASTIAVLLYLYTKYVLGPPTSIQPTEEQEEQYAPFHPLPENERAKNSAVDAVNYLFQFLFQEMKDSSRLRRYIMHKLNTEFNELKNSRTGKIFLQNIVIQSFSIGKECPTFSDIQLEHQERDERNLIKEFVAKLNADYKDGFSVTLDVTLVFGQKCQLFIKVKRIQGRLRLEMRREPFCHWLCVFQEEPLIDFEVKSYFATRESPQLANIVTQQLRRAIRRKQTWPSYKVRYTPFFPTSKQSVPTNLTSTNGNNLIPGKFEITLTHCDRLSIPLANFDKQQHQHSLSSMFLTVSTNPEMIADILHLKREQWTTKEIEFIRSTHKFSIKEVPYMDRTELLLDQLNPIPQTIEDMAEFKTALEEKNVFVFKIQGQEVKTLKQTNRVLKGKTIHPPTEGASLPTTTGTDDKLQLLVAIPVLHSIRVQRLVDVPSIVEPEKPNGTASLAASRADASSSSTTVRHRTPAATVKFDKSFDSIALNNVQSDGEEEQVSTITVGDSPTKSPPDSNANKKTKKSSAVSEITFMMMNVDLLQQFHAQPTTTRKAQKYVELNEKFDCQVGPNERFLNICLWCKSPLDCGIPNTGKKLVLLGYATVALSEIVLDAHLSFKRETQMTLNFRSPYSPKPNPKKRAELSAHKAYDDNLAHGFITIRIKHQPEIEERLDVQEKKEQFLANEPILTAVAKELKEHERREGQLKYINAIEVPPEQPSRKPTDHIFEDQTFPISTLCSCCHKKIWMKVGRRCRDCHATIHKKCQEKYNTDMPCPREPIDGPSKLVVISDDDIKSLTISDTISSNTITPSDDTDTVSFRSTTDLGSRGTTAHRLSTKAAAAFSAIDFTARRSFRAFGNKNTHATTATSLSPNLEHTTELSKSDDSLNGAVIIPSPVPTKRPPPAPPAPPAPPTPASSKLASAASSAYSRLREFKTKRLPIAPFAEAAVSAIRKTRSPSDSSSVLSENISETDLRDIIKKCLSDENNDSTGLEHLLRERAVDHTALYAKAREVGPELFLELALDERKQRLDSEISRLQQEIDLQCQIREELTRECNDDLTDENEKRKLRSKIVNIDEKVQALGALTILYCSGLKHWRTQMESQNATNSEPSPDDDDELTNSDDHSQIHLTRPSKSADFSDVFVQ